MINNQFREQLLGRFRRSGAHPDLMEALHGITFEQASKRNENIPYNIWQLTEHIRRTQYDIVEFCHNPDYKSPEWPEGYWPEKDTATSGEWEAALDQIRKDHDAFMKVLADPEVDLLEKFEHGTGQSFFNEALLIIDHNAYHTGQIILIRKINGWWP